MVSISHSSLRQWCQSVGAAGGSVESGECAAVAMEDSAESAGKAGGAESAEKTEGGAESADKAGDGAESAGRIESNAKIERGVESADKAEHSAKSAGKAEGSADSTGKAECRADGDILKLIVDPSCERGEESGSKCPSSDMDVPSAPPRGKQLLKLKAAVCREFVALLMPHYKLKFKQKVCVCVRVRVRVCVCVCVHTCVCSQACKCPAIYLFSPRYPFRKIMFTS